MGPLKHFYYPSAIVACGLERFDLRAAELECLRRLVTCPSCLARLEADKEICVACRLGAVGSPDAPPHTCDLALA